MKHAEADIQKGCVKWFRLQYPEYANLLFAVPNGGKRNRLEAARLKSEGVLSGVSDLILLVPSRNFHGLCIEMKAGKGQLTANQMRFIKAVQKQGYAAAVCWSLDEFMDTINHYLSQ